MITKSTLLATYNKPIKFSYAKPSQASIAALKQNMSCVALHNQDGIMLQNIYYQQQIAGSQQTMYTRKSVADKLAQLQKKLHPYFGLWIYDCYRSRETQSALFTQFYQNIATQNPQWSEQQVLAECKKYVSHPTDKSHFSIPLHLSGGAIDLALFDYNSGNVLDFGSKFDECRHHSHTDFFEKNFDAEFGISEHQWLDYRHMRRLLFYIMQEAGFVNYRYEWWHYDLGTCNWANELGCAHVYNELNIN